MALLSLLIAAADGLQHPADAALASWLTSAGVSSPKAAVVTTPRSVAGRGVFAVAPIAEDELIATIPSELILCDSSAAEAFAGLDVSTERELWGPHPWLARLAAYSVAANSTSSRRWSEWVAAWRRDDPVTRLFSSGVGRGAVPLERGAELSARLDDAAAALAAMSPIGIPTLTLRATLDWRYECFREHCEALLAPLELDLSRTDIGVLYATVSSRVAAIPGTGESYGIIPFHDFVNHGYDGQDNAYMVASEQGDIRILALRDIDAGEEVLFCYLDHDDDQNDEDIRAWALVNWGVP